MGIGIFPEYTGYIHYAAAFIAFVLYITPHDLGLGPGGMERMIAYPFVLWGLGFGGYLMQSCKETPPK